MPLKAAAGREQMLLSKDTKHCVEGGRFIGNRRRLPKARGIEAEMSCRRREGAGQSGSFASVKARAQGRAPEKKEKNRRKPSGGAVTFLFSEYRGRQRIF